KRLKIAVLDTGIDLNNPWVQQRAGRIQCWPSNKACEDTDGHGTQVAYLLLRLAPHTHLRIAKVAKSQLLRDADVDDIAKAILEFSSPDSVNRVDVINLSFGFPRFHPKLQPVLNAIRTARSRRVLVFAAAGNEGGNQGIFWPAKLHETGDVICINASDSDGNASSFNPSTGSNNRICTIGEALPSCEKNKQNEIIHRSGTSFATPVAVAIAAIVLSYADSVAPENAPPNFEEWIKPRLRTKSGMERILHTMCVLPDQKRRDGYSYITPWYFLDIHEKSRAHILSNELRTIPE
ncbi:peptidase S8/S53 domain-containing protein, partial [Clohesyomyces aquaticus]